jgi:hypothetical protein
MDHRRSREETAKVVTDNLTDGLAEPMRKPTRHVDAVKRSVQLDDIGRASLREHA